MWSIFLPGTVTIALTVLVLDTAGSEQNPACLPSTNSCTFYDDCLEPVVHCGPDGYPLGFGFKFCEMFFRYMDKFSPHGQKFLHEVTFCLQNALFPEASRQVSVNCTGLREMAFSTHYPCYTQGNVSFCTLSVQDLSVLAFIVRKEFANSENYPTAFNILRFCGKHPIQLLEGKLNSIPGISVSQRA